MPQIIETSFGYELVFESTVARDAARKMLEELRRRVRPREGGFTILVDLRATRTFTAEAQEMVKQTILICREAGMGRNAVVTQSVIAGLQARRMVKETGIAPSLRYIDASLHSDWRQQALAWLIDGIEPAEGGEPRESE
jgi:hypothetical protein